MTAVEPLRALTLPQLRRRTSEKWRRHPDDVLPLFVAEMDVPLAEPVLRAVADAMALGDTGYPVGTAYVDALAGFARARWGWDGIAAERASLVPDVMAGLAEALRLMTDPGAPVVLNDPVYPPYFELVRHLGRRVVEVPLRPDHRLDLDALARAYATLAAEGPAHLLCNPQNPTGTVHTADELAAVAALAAEHGVRVVADEIFAPLVAAGARFVPYLSVAGTATAMAVASASKGWNLAGLKAAVLLGGADTGDEIAGLPSFVADGASHVAVLAHTAALREGGEWLDGLRRDVAANHALLAELVAEHLPGVRCAPPAATYLAWLDCRSTGLGDDPAAAFLERGRVALVPGPAFGTRGAGHVRLNVATTPEILTDAVTRMAAVLR